MNEKQLHILQHSLGLDKYGHGTFYRNHFVTGEGSDDHDDCMALVNLGFMTFRPGNALSGGDDVFRVTDAGKAAIAEYSPAPPKLTRSQQNYRDWLSYDSDISFGDWLKYRSKRSAA